MIKGKLKKKKGGGLKNYRIHSNLIDNEVKREKKIGTRENILHVRVTVELFVVVEPRRATR